MISHLGRYEIIGELGKGAMGIVYKAKDPIIDRILAIKTISLNLTSDEKDEYEARFYQEAKAAGRLSHPNIVTVYDVGKSGDVAYIAMEFLQGRELHDILNEGKRLPVSQVLDIVKQVAQGLAYAHEHGIVHRDVKPSNIMVIHDGHVKITDFGIARMTSSTVQTQAGVVLGSPKYMSPEQVLGKSIDQRTDIFSLGVMLYEMLSGRPPFVGDTIHAVMHHTVNATPAPPSTLNHEIPAMLDFIVAKALAKSVDDRYQNAREFADDLRACRDALPRLSTMEEQAKPQPASRNNQPTPVANTGLPSHSDSFEATMRLADLTAKEVEDIGKTLKITRPDGGTIDQSVTVAAQSPANKSTVITRTLPLHANPDKKTGIRHSANDRKLLVILIVLLVLLGLALLL